MKYKYLLSIDVSKWADHMIKTCIQILDRPIDEDYINQFEKENDCKIISFSKFE